MKTLLFLDVSGGELLVIILVVFLVFGPSKMPEIARKMGKWMNELKRASNQITREFRQETSGIRDEINNAHSSLTEGANKLKSEINSTKQTVSRNMTIDLEDKPSSDSDAEVTEQEIIPPDKE